MSQIHTNIINSNMYSSPSCCKQNKIKFKTLYIKKLEEARTHRSAKTYAGNVFMTCGLDVWPRDPNFLPSVVRYLSFNFTFITLTQRLY